MISWRSDIKVYLHRDVVDFRKSINGLSIIVSEEMELPLYSNSIFVFCNRSKDKLKVLFWDHTGFVLWYKRLEKDKFKWPRKSAQSSFIITPDQWNWLLQGIDISKVKPHKNTEYSALV